MASQSIISFLIQWICMFFTDDDTEHKVDDSDDGWVLDCELWKRRVKLCQRVMATLPC